MTKRIIYLLINLALAFFICLYFWINQDAEGINFIAIAVVGFIEIIVIITQIVLFILHYLYKEIKIDFGFYFTFVHSVFLVAIYILSVYITIQVHKSIVQTIQEMSNELEQKFADELLNNFNPFLGMHIVLIIPFCLQLILLTSRIKRAKSHTNTENQ